MSLGIDYNITWMKVGSISQGVVGKDINITTVTAVGDPTTTVTLTFDPLRFGDRGTYICMAEFNITTTLDGGDGSDEYDIIVDCELLMVLHCTIMFTALLSFGHNFTSGPG